MTNRLYELPGAWSAERNLLLAEARRRRALQAAVALLVVLLAGAAGFGFYPCPGHLGQY